MTKYIKRFKNKKAKELTVGNHCPEISILATALAIIS